jgi:GT2 family glycosyltransferase
MIDIRFSVVVPAYEAGATLRRCLDSIAAQLREGDELIVVDDASRQPYDDTVAGLPVRLLRLPVRSGAAAARNHGAAAACGDHLFFVDADVVLSPGALQRARARLASGDWDAVFGSYDDRPAAVGLVSQFKNLAHHHFHQRSAGMIASFWSGCGAVRRDLFAAAGGFDSRRYRAASIEDVELGLRLSARGARILLDPELCVTHLKRWTLLSFLRTDLLQRAIPWTELALERGMLPATLNFTKAQRLAALLPAAAIAALLLPRGRWLALTLCATAACCLNADLYQLLYRRGGPRLTIAGFLLQQLYYLNALLGLILGALRYSYRQAFP